MGDHYETLGVPRNAPLDAIKKAYRKLARKAHPDREGGSHSVMAELTVAWGVLGDASKRERYDATGQSTAPKTLESRAETQVILLVESWLNEEAEYPSNLVSRFRQVANTNTANVKASLVTLRRKLAKTERARKRLVGAEFIGSLVDGKIEAITAQIAAAEESLEVDVLVLALLGKLSDTADGSFDGSPSVMDQLKLAQRKMTERRFIIEPTTWR